MEARATRRPAFGGRALSSTLTSARALFVATVVGAMLPSSFAAADDDEAAPAAEAPPVEWVMKALGVKDDDPHSLSPEQRDVAVRAGQRLVSLCPHCRPSTISEEGPCGWARVNRQIIRNAAAMGMGEEDIVRTYVQVYGARVLSVPKDTGFAAASWIVPYVTAILSLVVLFLVGRRLGARRQEDPGRGDEGQGPGITSDARSVDREILQTELASLDE